MRFAIDTNIAIYALIESDRRPAAMRLIAGGPHISVQLLNEFANVAIKKFNRTWAEIDLAIGSMLVAAQSIRPVDQDVHFSARTIADSYQLSFYDSLMLSAALLDNCTEFYSEDMHHGLIIDDRLTIRNPFLPDQDMP